MGFRLSLLALFFLALSHIAFAGEVWVLSLKGVVNPPMAHYIGSNLQRSQKAGVDLVVLTIDTPGGLDTSMREIIKAIFSTTTPVVTFVYPSGARAASAGLYITLSGSLAAMAPGTNIGAAHPVSLGVKMDETMVKKVTNDAWAYLKSISQMRGHFHPWLEKAVKESESLAARDALKIGIIDMVVPNLSLLIERLEKENSLISKLGLRSGLKSPSLKNIEPSFRDRFLYFISHPNVAYILAVVGFYGIIFELSNPGLIFPGIVGVIFMVISFYAFHTLPINYAGLFLLLFGLFLMILDIKIPSHGLLSISGVISFVLGSTMLVESPAPYLRLSLKFIFPVAILTALFIGVLVALGVRSQFKRTITGLEGMVGERGRAITEVNRKGGRIFIHGEIWKARSYQFIPPEASVKVVGVKGLILEVEPCEGEESPPSVSSE